MSVNWMMAFKYDDAGETQLPQENADTPQLFQTNLGLRTLADCGKRLPHPTFPLSNLPQRGRTKSTSGAERRSELTSLRGAHKKVGSQLIAGAERFFISK